MTAVMFLLTSNVFAVSNDEIYSASQLKSLGILKGYSDGSLKLERPIRRSEIATIAVRMLNPNNDKVKGKIKNFNDLPRNHWAYNTVSDAYNLGVINGYPDGSFKPNNNISYAEVVTIMVNCLLDGKKLKGEWPKNYIEKAKEMEILPADDDREGSKIINRGEMAQIVWHSILVQKQKND